MLPPIFDGPTTRGLFDERSGVLWGVRSGQTGSVTIATTSPKTSTPSWSRCSTASSHRGTSGWTRHATDKHVDYVAPRVMPPGQAALDELFAATVLGQAAAQP